MSLPHPEYAHLLELIDDTGILEHSRYGVPRREDGYTTDDATRAAIVLCRAEPQERIVDALRTLLAFILYSMTDRGTFRNRLNFDRRWHDVPENGDTQGRAFWALAVAGAHAPRSDLRDAAASALAEAQLGPSPHIRPVAYAALAAQVLWSNGQQAPNPELLAAPLADRLAAFSGPWPETRLSYANGRIPAAMLAAGEVLDRPELIEKGLEALAWLLEVEGVDGRLSFTPVGGWEPGDPRPGFDQQPIEASALGDACERAWVLTGEERWKNAALLCGAWLMGANDAGVAMYDERTGATFDGLTSSGVNANSGAESTIAGLDVLQMCERLTRPEMLNEASATRAAP